jgi:hypothetical protein
MAYLGPLRATLSSRSPGNRELHQVFVRPLFPFELLPRRTIARGHKLARRAPLEIVSPRSSRCRQRSIDRIAVSLKRISSEKNSLTLPAAARSLQIVCRWLLTNSQISVHTAAPRNAVELAGAL